MMSKKKMSALLQEWLDMYDEPCYYDHHGCCQAHFLEDKGNCIVERTRNLLKEYGCD